MFLFLFLSCQVYHGSLKIRRLHNYAKNIAWLAEMALKFLEMAQLDYANQENNEDDDSSIQYQVLSVFSKGLVVGEFCLSMLNLKGKH